MKQFKTAAIVLRRVNYGEADRIITFLTEERGKVSAIAKGVRKPKSKLSGGLEPFSESTITFGEGRGELQIVLSTRLDKFYQNILADYDRLQFGYEALKLVDRSTEDIIEEPFYDLLHKTFAYLDALQIAPGFTEVWFRMQLESLLGRMPDLFTDIEGQRLEAGQLYAYDVHERGLAKSGFGNLTTDHLKFLRLSQQHSPAELAAVQNAPSLVEGALGFVRQLG